MSVHLPPQHFWPLEQSAAQQKPAEAILALQMLGCWRSCTVQEQDSLVSSVQAAQSLLSAVHAVQHLLPPHTFLPAHGDLNRAWAEVGQTTCAQLCWFVCLARFVALWPCKHMQMVLESNTGSHTPDSQHCGLPETSM